MSTEKSIFSVALLVLLFNCLNHSETSELISSSHLTKKKTAFFSHIFPFLFVWSILIGDSGYCGQLLIPRDPKCCGQFKLDECSRNVQCPSRTYGDARCTFPWQTVCICIDEDTVYDPCSHTCVYFDNCPSPDKVDECSHPRKQPYDFCDEVAD